MAFPDGWGRKQKITIDNTKVIGSASLTDYPMLVTLDHLDSEIVDAGSNSALNGGGDIRFSSDADGLTQLPCEIVDFVTNATPGSRACEIWVEVPSVSDSVDTDFYIWYKKAAETQPAVTDTYGRNAVWSNYEVVCHDGGATDSTGNTTPTKTGLPTSTTGKFTDAIDYGGNADEWHYRSTISDLSIFTLQAWAYIDVIGSSPQGVMGLRNTESVRVSLFIDNSPDDWGPWDNVNSWLRSSQAGEVGAWHSVATTYNGTTDRRIFYEGTKLATDSTVSTITTNKTILEMGGPGAATQRWDGKLCEVRLSPNALTDDWITTEYNNQNAPATFATAGTPEAVGGAVSSLLLLQRSFRQ